MAKKLEDKSSLELAVEEIHKIFGKESIFKMGSVPANIEVISTGSIFLDKALGVGGLPKGRIIELYGPEGSGKTTLALHIIAQAQKKGGNVAFIDAEHALDLKYAKSLGINVGEVLISQPNCGEEALEIAETLTRSNDISIIVIDSVSALTPKAEIEGDMGQSHMGLQARLMSQALRKLAGINAKSNSILLFINQMRSKINVMYGSPETTSGGNALKFYASIRLDIRKRELIKKGDIVIGQEVLIKVVKNKVASPFQEARTSIIFGKGIYHPAELLIYHLDNNNIEKAGSWYRYKNEKIQGDDKMIKFIENNIEEFEIKNI